MGGVGWFLEAPPRVTSELRPQPWSQTLALFQHLLGRQVPSSDSPASAHGPLPPRLWPCPRSPCRARTPGRRLRPAAGAGSRWPRSWPGGAAPRCGQRRPSSPQTKWGEGFMLRGGLGSLWRELCGPVGRKMSGGSGRWAGPQGCSAHPSQWPWVGLFAATAARGPGTQKTLLRL